MKPSVLVVDDEKTFRIVVEEALSADGFEVVTASTGESGLAAWQREPTDFVILDRNLPDIDGVQLLESILKEARERDIDTLVVMATAYADVASAVHALKIGAFDYLSKPVRLPELIVTFRQAIETKRLRTKVRQLVDLEKATVGDFVAGNSPAVAQVLGMVDKVAQAPDTTVLIQGESGTGKQLIANLVHRRTPVRSEQPLVEINCASLPENLLESELFGYERGAFTDAKAQKRGLFEGADGGTLFLDEIGEMPPGTQAKLLKVLEEMTFRRLGGTRDLRVNVRVIAATNKDLAAEVKRGTFRLDLYHRLDVFHLRLPPLREHPEDIPPLAAHFLSMFARRMRKPGLTFSAEADRILRGYAYPGNVRELRNLVERAVILSTTPVIGADCIVLSGPAVEGVSATHFFSLDMDAATGKPPTLEQLEREYIARLLDHAQGNRTQVARLLGVSYPTVAKKIADYGLKGEKA
jgi:two-component system, NtrC family, response regulator AtoC